MKKVLAILNTPRYSGAEKVVLTLFENNAELNVTAVVSENFNSPFQNIKFVKTSLIKSLNRKSNSVSASFKYLPKAFLLNVFVAKLILKNKYDVVHVNNIPVFIYLAPLVFLFRKIFRSNIIFIFHDHNLRSVESNGVNRIQHIAANQYEKIIGVSNKFREKYNSTDKEIDILYNGIDQSKYRFDHNSRMEIREKIYLKNKIVLGMFGSINKHKGQLGLVNVVKKIKADFPDLHILFIGKIDESDQNFYDDFEKQVKINRDLITVLDERGDIHFYYSAIDVLVNNTGAILEEPLGTTILEGMSCGRIVAAANSGGTPEIIDDGIDGYLFKPDSEEDLEIKLREIFSNETFHDKIKDNAVEKIKSKFSIQQMVKNYNEIIDN